jgi:hypothetical protein
MHFSTKRISRPIPTKIDKSSMDFFCWLTASSSTLALSSAAALTACFFCWLTALSSSTPAISSCLSYLSRLLRKILFDMRNILFLLVPTAT